MNTRNPSEVKTLPRGGYLVETSRGYIQFGAPPETIKDTMTLDGGVPSLFVLPHHLFNPLKGISIAEMEFPLYYNFFIRKKRTTIICTERQAEQMKAVLRESLFGPDDPAITGDYLIPLAVPDLAREYAYFRTMKLDEVVRFITFSNNRADADGLTVAVDRRGEFILSEDGIHIARIPGTVEYTPRYSIGERLREPFIPPLFGLTCLGASSGFDPHDNTSGFILWINHHGIMIDPPVNTTEWLLDSNVSPKFIDSIILTHCHADHDAGTMQKILEEHRITVYTTDTVLKSFLRKYGAFTGFPGEYLRTLFSFHPVKIDRPLFIHGATFRFFYTLHSIPAIGFTATFQDRKIVYSSDHNNDPALRKKLLEEGVISPERFRELSSFPWDADLIYHESGVPPLHTPLKCLAELPDEVKKRIVVYHIPDKDVPADSGLVHARFGIENTRVLKTPPPPFETAYQVMSLFRSMDFFEHMSVHDAQDFIANIRERRYRKGEIIIEAGSEGDDFYIIHHGNVSILDAEGKVKKIFGTYDYFGETALVRNNPRSATVVAETDVLLYSIEKEKFLHFVRDTEYEKIILRLAENRDREVWDLFSASPALRICTPTQKTWLESMLEPETRKSQGTIIREGDDPANLYLVRKGTVTVEREGEVVNHLKTGGIVGSITDVYRGLPSAFTYRHEKNISLYRISRRSFLHFLEKNPGLIMKLAYGEDDRFVSDDPPGQSIP